MGVRREPTNDPDAQRSPWSTGDVEAGPAPEFTWDRPDPLDPPDPTDDSSAGHRTQILVAVGCALVLLVGAVVLWPDTDEPTDSDSAAAGSESDTTLVTLPDTDDEPVDSPPPTDPASSDGATAENDDLLANAPAAADGEISSIELPAPVAAIARPTEVVLLDDDGLVTLSIPSGNVRRVQVNGTVDSGIVIAPDATAWFGGSNLNIAPRTGPPLTARLDNGTTGGGYVADWVTDADGETRFLVDTFDQDENRRLTVGADGDVAEYEPETRFDTFDFYGGLRSQGGETIVNDAGGAYVIDANDAVTRISTGRALGVNEGFALLRECTEALECTYVVLDRRTGERRVSPATSEQLGRPFGFDLAPDGSATIAYDAEGDARRIVDLVDGGIVGELQRPSGSNRNTQWAADGSGVFEADPGGGGLLFVDRTSGESVQFAAELGRVRELGVRWPESEAEPTDATVARRPLAFSDALAGPVDLDIVALGDLGAMAHLDLDATSASVWSVPTVAGSNDPDLIALGDEVVVLPRSLSDGFVSTFGSTAPLVLANGAEPPGFLRFPASVPGVVWSPRNGREDGVDHEVVAVRNGLSVEDVGAEVRLPNSDLLGGDGNGSLVARVGGDVFVVDAVGTTRLTDGDLLALGPDDALVRTCDDALRCSVDRLDRATGDAVGTADQPTEITDVLTDARSVEAPARSPMLSGTMSPDGGAALVRTAPAGDATRWVLVDFATGGRVDVPSPEDGHSIIWNDRSTVAVYLSEGEIVLLDRTAGRVSTLRGVGEVRSITSVGPSFAVSAAEDG